MDHAEPTFWITLEDLLAALEAQESLSGFEHWQPIGEIDARSDAGGSPAPLPVPGENPPCDEFREIDARPFLRATLGSDCRDLITDTHGTDNWIEARGGDDRVLAGDGMDFVFGGAGNDWLDGGAGRDDISGGAQDDTILGGDGTDELFGGHGDDLILAGSRTGSFSQPGLQLPGGFDADSGASLMFGGQGDDTLIGTDGHDHIGGGLDRDQIYAGAGSDWVVSTLDEVDTFSTDTIYLGRDADADVLLIAAVTDGAQPRDHFGEDHLYDFNPDDGDEVRLDDGLRLLFDEEAVRSGRSGALYEIQSETASGAWETRGALWIEGLEEGQIDGIDLGI